MSARIWGISGQARSGKDTIAARLVQAHGFTRVGWADPMKRFVQDLFAFSDEQVWEGSKKEDPDPRYLRRVRREGTDPALTVEVPEYLTPRYALQTIGTDWGRDCYPAVWIEYGLRIAQALLAGPLLDMPEYGNGIQVPAYSPKRGLVYERRVPSLREGVPAGVIFSDCRFRNELEAIRAAGGVLVRVKRPGKDGDVGISGHSSETEMREIGDGFFDAVVDNAGTLEELTEAVDWLAQRASIRMPRPPRRVLFTSYEWPNPRDKGSETP